MPSLPPTIVKEPYRVARAMARLWSWRARDGEVLTPHPLTPREPSRWPEQSPSYLYHLPHII
jgi:hypothetical protein